MKEKIKKISFLFGEDNKNVVTLQRKPKETTVSYFTTSFQNEFHDKKRDDDKRVENVLAKFGFLK